MATREVRVVEEWMRMALEQAKQAFAEGEVPVGAVLVQGERLLCACRNRREALHDPTAHAEILCLQEGARLLGNWRLRGCTLYVTLEPCPMCAGAMVMSQLSQCVFGAPDPQKGCCGSVYDLPNDPALGGSTQWTAGVLVEECKALLDAFFQKKRAKQP